MELPQQVRSQMEFGNEVIFPPTAWLRLRKLEIAQMFEDDLPIFVGKIFVILDQPGLGFSPALLPLRRLWVGSAGYW